MPPSVLLPPRQFFCLHRARCHPHLPPFPTRRSSDLDVAGGRGAAHRPQRRPLPHRAVHEDIAAGTAARSEEQTSELQSPMYLVCRLLLEKKKRKSQHSKGGSDR